LAAVFGVGAVVTGAALLRSSSNPALSARPVGLVSSVMPAAPRPPAVVSPVEPEPRIEVVIAASADPVAQTPAPKPTQVAAAARRAVKPAPPAVKDKTSRPGGQVGGVGISNEF
jgi:hypothetical protein